MSEEKYCFRLRADMPIGFKSNPRFPELPAILKYLTQFEGKEYSTSEEFQKNALDGFLDYLEQEKVPTGKDPKLREGLRLRKEDDGSYLVFTFANSHVGFCGFGWLEEKVEESS